MTDQLTLGSWAQAGIDPRTPKNYESSTNVYKTTSAGNRRVGIDAGYQRQRGRLATVDGAAPR